MSDPSAAQPAHLTYAGPARFTELIAEELRSEGLEVSYRSPMEQRSAAATVTVAVSFYVLGKVGDRITDAALDLIVARIKERLKSRFGAIDLERKDD